MIEKHNFHWKTGFSYGYPKRRDLFRTLANEIKSRQIISIIGLRRTGKTTILKQIIDHLISKGTKREHILFYSFDEDQPKLDELMQEYETLLGSELMGMKDKVFVFLDEIQKLKGWQNQIKYYYDNYSNIKFFLSGSSSLFIRKHAQESLAGRIFEYILNPLSFREFLMFRGNEELVSGRNMMKDKLKKEFLAYQKRQFIETVGLTEESAGHYIKSVIEKIVYQDIPKSYPINNEELLLKLMNIIASRPGMISDYKSLSEELGIGRTTISNYVFYLEESFLVTKLYNYSRNRLTSEKKMKRLYLSSTSFFPCLNSSIERPALVENLIVLHSNARFFWRTPQGYEVDVILADGNDIMPLEVKYRESISKSDMKNLLRFCERFGCKKAVLVTKGKKGEQEFRGKNKETVQVCLIPAWEYCLMDIDSIKADYIGTKKKGYVK